MKKDLLNLIVCPACQGDFSLRDEIISRDEIVGGVLKCSGCSSTYMINKGVADLISSDLHPDRSEIGHSAAGVVRANRDYHDRHASTYETDPHTNYMFLESCQKRIEGVVKWASKRSGGGLSLDIGCGTGNVLKFLAANFRRAIGIDLSPGMMNQIPKMPADTFLASGTATPFPEGVFDFVSAFSVLHHMFEPTHVLQEAFRILKPGGIFYSDWDFNDRFRTRLLFSLWLHNFNPFKAFKGFIDHFVVKNEDNEIFTMAEYHAFKGWMDAESLQDSSHDIGFSNVHLIYHWNQPSIIGPDEEPRHPEVKGFPASLTMSRSPSKAFPIFSIIAERSDEIVESRNHGIYGKTRN